MVCVWNELVRSVQILHLYHRLRGIRKKMMTGLRIMILRLTHRIQTVLIYSYHSAFYLVHPH
jgi:hypothetical protein